MLPGTCFTTAFRCRPDWPLVAGTPNAATVDVSRGRRDDEGFGVHKVASLASCVAFSAAMLKQDCC